jgi:rhomboid protease GluP
MITLATCGWSALWSPSSEMLLRVGADFGPLTMSGDYWRIVSNTFIHVGILHLAMNMWVLQDVGKVVETLFGSTKFLTIYLLAGIGASLNSLFWNPLIISAGASGAVFGVFGAMLAFFWVHRSYFPASMVQAHSRSVLILLLYNFLYGVSVPGIDNSAHIGGLISGFIASLCLMPIKPGQINWRWIDLLRVVPLLCLFMWLGTVDKQKVEDIPAHFSLLN